MSEIRGLKTGPQARPTCLCWEEEKPMNKKDGAANGVEGPPGEWLGSRQQLRASRHWAEAAEKTGDGWRPGH